VPPSIGTSFRKNYGKRMVAGNAGLYILASGPCLVPGYCCLLSFRSWRRANGERLSGVRGAGVKQERRPRHRASKRRSPGGRPFPNNSSTHPRLREKVKRGGKVNLVGESAWVGGRLLWLNLSGIRGKESILLPPRRDIDTHHRYYSIRGEVL